MCVEHKISSANYLMNRMLTYPITKEAKEKEVNIIRDILLNNEYNKNLSTRHSKSTQGQQKYRQHHKTKWAIFTYSGKETKKITKLFKETHIGIAFGTRNTIQKLVKPRPQKRDRYGRNGMHQMKCMDCLLKLWRTGQTFYTIHKEHVQAIRNNNINSGYSNHILSTRHAYGTITDAIEIMEIERESI
jgi:hypothetical protein